MRVALAQRSFLLRGARKASQQGRVPMAAAHQQTSAVAQKRDVVVISGGVAAGYIARVFAEHGGCSRLTVLEGIDPALPYERPALTNEGLPALQRAAARL